LSFLKKEKPYKDLRKKSQPFYKRKGWRIFFITLGSVIVVLAGIILYLVNSGSKIFEKGIGGSALINALSGKQTLKGESEDRINVLLLGMGGPNHPGGLLTDSIMILSIKPKEKKVAMLSIPRDLYVPINGYGNGKINSAFSSGYNNYMANDCQSKNRSDCEKDAMSQGAKISSETISQVTGLPIHYYITAEFSGFEKIIDLLGGIDINVDKAIYDPYFPDQSMKGYAAFRMNAGQQHMDGVTALKYARSRETTSDFDRAARQQKIIVAVKEKAAGTDWLTNPKKILDIFNTFTDSVYTNFTVAELRSFIDLAKALDTGSVISKVLKTGPDGELVDYNNGTYYLKPKTGDFSQIQKIAKDIFGDNSEEGDVKVDILNGVLQLQNSDLSGLSRELSDDKDVSFEIMRIADADNVYKKTVIYDYTGGTKLKALRVLEEKLNADSVQKTAGSHSTDFSIIIGEDYQNL